MTLDPFRIFGMLVVSALCATAVGVAALDAGCSPDAAQVVAFATGAVFMAGLLLADSKSP